MGRHHRVVPAVPRLALIGLVLTACWTSTTVPSGTPAAPAGIASASVAASTAAPGATPGPTASLAPNAVARYESELGYSVDLPLEWRRAVCGTGILRRDPLVASDSFTAVAETDEVLSDIGVHDPRVAVRVQSAQGRAPQDWLPTVFAGGPGARIETVTVDGRPGARLAVIATGETLAWAVAGRGWLYGIGHEGPPATGGTAQDAAVILGSLRILEQAALLDPARPTPEPRSAEQVADVLAAAFAAKDPSALMNVMEPCIGTAMENAGPVAVSRSRYAEQLRQMFLGGLAVTVQARPIETDAYATFVRSQWSEPGQADRRIDLVLTRQDGDRWGWSLALVRRTT